MRKIALLLALLILAAGLASCGTSPGESSKEDPAETSGNSSAMSTSDDSDASGEETEPGETEPANTNENDKSSKTGSKTNSEATPVPSSPTGSSSSKTIDAKGTELVKGLKLSDLRNKKLKVATGYTYSSAEQANKPSLPNTFYHMLVSWKKTYGVDIEIVTGGNDIAYLTSASAAGNMPDLISGPVPAAYGLTKSLNGLINLNDPLYHNNEVDSDYASYIKNCVVVKKIQREYVIFNQTRFAMEGRKTPLKWYNEGKWSWTQFAKTAREMTNVSKGQYGLGRVIDDRWSPYPMLKTDSSGKVTFDIESNTKHISFVTEAAKLSADTARPNGGSVFRQEFPKGNDAMVIANEYEFSQFCDYAEKNNGDDFGIAPMPYFDIAGETKARYTYDNMVYCIASKSKNPAAAVEAIKMLAHINNQMGVQMGKYESADKYLTDAERTALNAQEKTAGAYQFIYKINGCTALLEEVRKHAGYTGGTGVLAAYKSVTPQIKQQLDEYNKLIKK